MAGGEKINMSIYHRKQGCCCLRTRRRAAQSVKSRLLDSRRVVYCLFLFCATATVVRPPLSIL